MSNEQAWSEEFDSDKEFHRKLQSLLQHDGILVSLNWMPAPPPTANYPWVGLAVLHKGIELVTRRFSVEPEDTRYHLRVMGRIHTVNSDYFEGFK